MDHTPQKHRIAIYEEVDQELLKGASEIEIDLSGSDVNKDIQENDIVIMFTNNKRDWTGKVLIRVKNSLRIKILNNIRDQKFG